MRNSVYLSESNGYKWISRILVRSTAASTNYAQQENKNDPVKPYKDIPGPKGLPIVDNLLDVYKNKRYFLTRTHELFTLYSKRYGSIFKCRIGALDIVYISDPEDVPKVFQAEGQYANRGDVVPWVVYRKQHKKLKGILMG